MEAATASAQEAGEPQAHRLPLAAPARPARPAPRRAGRLARDRLPGLARGAVRGVAVAARRLQRRDRPRRPASRTSRSWRRRRSTATIVGRTVAIAAAVTVTDALLAFPIAFYMAKVATPRVRALLVVAVLMPLWSSYLVKVYSWRIMLQESGIVNWALEPFGLHGPGFGNVATWLVFSYLWLPVHGAADLRRARAHPELDARRLGRPRRQALDDLPAGGPAARAAGGRGGLDLHVLAHAGRLHHAHARLEHAVHRQRRLQQRRASPTTCRWPRRSPRCRWRS